MDSDGLVGEYTSIALDSADNVHISYTSSIGLMYITIVSGSWVADAVDFCGSSAMYSSIALDSSDKAHISYYGQSNSNLKYAAQR